MGASVGIFSHGTNMKSFISKQSLKLITLSSVLLSVPGCADEAESGDSAAAKVSTDTGTNTDPANATPPDATPLCTKKCEAFARCGGDAKQSNAECMAGCLETAGMMLAKAPQACLGKEEIVVDCVLATERCEDWVAWLAWLENDLTGPAPLCEAQTRDVHENCWKVADEG